jgi:hypothetical protein
MSTGLCSRSMELIGMKGIFFSWVTPPGFQGSILTRILRLKPEVIHSLSFQEKKGYSSCN